MFCKLLKHEFKETARMIPFIFLLCLLISSVSLILVIFNLTALSLLAVLLTTILAVAQVYVVNLLVLWRYYKSMYGHQAYLTHTLPIRSSAHYWSKLLVGMFWLFMSNAVVVVVLAFSFFSIYKVEEGHFPALSDLWLSFLKSFGMVGRGAFLICVIVSLIVLLTFVSLVQHYFAISLGSVSKFHRLGIGGPIIVFIIQYLSLQALYLGALAAIPAGIRLYINDSGVLAIERISGSMIAFSNAEFDIVAMLFPTVFLSSSPSEFLATIDAGSIILTPILCGFFLVMTLWLIRKRTSLR